MGYIKDVVDHLEGKADVVAEIGQRLKLGGCAISAHAPEPSRAGEQGAGFAFVDVLELWSVQLLPFAFEVSDLPGDELK